MNFTENLAIHWNGNRRWWLNGTSCLYLDRSTFSVCKTNANVITSMNVDGGIIHCLVFLHPIGILAVIFFSSTFSEGIHLSISEEHSRVFVLNLGGRDHIAIGLCRLQRQPYGLLIYLIEVYLGHSYYQLALTVYTNWKSLCIKEPILSLKLSRIYYGAEWCANHNIISGLVQSHTI